MLLPGSCTVHVCDVREDWAAVEGLTSATHLQSPVQFLLGLPYRTLQSGVRVYEFMIG